MSDWRALLIAEDSALRRILEECRTIAVVGMKPGPLEVSARIPLFMRAQGYRIFPVNPKYENLHGMRCYPTLLDLPQPVAMVNLFRSSTHIPGHAAEALQLQPKVFWMQLGIQNDEAAEQLARNGIQVVQDRCLMVEYRRLAEPSQD